MSTANPPSTLLDRMTEAHQRVTNFVSNDNGGTQSRYSYPTIVYNGKGQAMYLRVGVKYAKDLPSSDRQSEPDVFPDLSDLGVQVEFYIPSPELVEGRPSYGYLVQRASVKARKTKAAILVPLHQTMSGKASLLIAANKAVSIIPEPDVSIGELALFAIRLRRILRKYMHRSVQVQVFLEFNRRGLQIQSDDSVPSIRRRLRLS